MTYTRSAQFGIAFCLALSLMASAVSACTCLHHQQNEAAEQHSCHNEASEKAEADSSPVDTRSISGAGCSCFEIVPKLSAKSENPKLKKHALANSPERRANIAFVSHFGESVKTFAKPLYLSDSFYNISPSRGPPRA
jgi:hypothetical protein